jgi:predicted RNase H-like HicB family nuclease
MSETITVSVKLRAFVRKATKSRWVAVCPAVGVASQGDSPADAKRSIKEAVQLWFESCIERGVLERALQEANFRRIPYEHLGQDSQHVTVSRTTERDDVLGDAFRINVEIPAYQAAALIGASA